MLLQEVNFTGYRLIRRTLLDLIGGENGASFLDQSHGKA